MTSATCVAPMMQVKTTITPRARTTNGPIGEKHQMGAQWLGGRAEKTSTIRWNSTRRRRAAVLRILAALFLAMLPAPVGARAKKVHGDYVNANYICAGTLRKSPYSDYYSIGGSGCSVAPGKASKAILAVCQEGDTCIVHAFGEITIRTEYNIKRVIGVGKLCT